MKRSTTRIFWVYLCSLTVAVAAVSAGGVVDNTSTGFTPITDLGSDLYRGVPGGLYPSGSNTMPAAHAAAGLALASQIQPLDASGNPSPSGRIGIISTGMSNASQIFAKVDELMLDLWHPQVVFVNADRFQRHWKSLKATVFSLAGRPASARPIR